MRAYLVLGCNRYVDKDGFRYSESLSNPVVDLSKIDSDKKESVIEFLDSACGLFDAPMYNYNKCVNTLGLLNKTFGIINTDALYKIQGFIKMHKRGGIFLMLIMKEDYNE